MATNARTWPALAGAMAACLVPVTAGAQTTNEAGYAVTRNQTVTQAPHGSVGRKSVDTETRVGNTEETDGNSASYTLTLGGFVKYCPNVEGVVDGNFEYAIVADIVDTDAVPTARTHYANRMTANLKGHVRNDAELDFVEGEAEFVRERTDTPTERQTFPLRFTPSRDGRPDFPAMEAAVEATADISSAILIWQAGQVFLDAELQWKKINECAELVFEPASETVSLGANQSATVRTQLRAKDGQAPVPDGKLDINTIQGIGTADPRSATTTDDGSARVTYTASANPQRGHGLDIGAVSRAGVANALWKITEPGLVLTIEHRLATRRDTPKGKGGWAIFDGTVNFDAVFRPDADWPGRQVAELRMVRSMTVSHGTGKCSGHASEAEDWELRGTIDPASNILTLAAGIYPDSDTAEGFWVCDYGDRQEVYPDLESMLGLGTPLTMPAATGSQQAFTMRDDLYEETLTVTVKSGTGTPR